MSVVVRRQKELLLVLANKSSHEGSQRKWPSIVRWGNRGKGGEGVCFLQIESSVAWGTKEKVKLNFGVADSFFSKWKM